MKLFSDRVCDTLNQLTGYHSKFYQYFFHCYDQTLPCLCANLLKEVVCDFVWVIITESFHQLFCVKPFTFLWDYIFPPTYVLTHINLKNMWELALNPTDTYQTYSDNLNSVELLSHFCCWIFLTWIQFSLSNTLHYITKRSQNHTQRIWLDNGTGGWTHSAYRIS